MAFRFLFATALTAITASAQTWTSCNPLNTTCPADTALGTSATFNFTDTPSTKIWNMTAGPMTYGANGAEFTISAQGTSPTIQSTFYLMFGSVSVFMIAAKGQGVISSIVLESDDLDEVDWEFMGGNSTHVETNYFGKGNTTAFDRAIYYPVSNPQENYHNYTTHWTADKLEWWIDGQLVRTLPYAAANGGLNYPQTPMNVRLGIWAGGDSKNSKGTIEWAGGITDYSGVPYTMIVKNITANDFSTGASYSYSDKSGTWQSIKATAGNSTVVKAIADASKPTGLSAHWNALPKTTRTAIVACAIGGAIVVALALLACCWHQGRKGKQEKAIADQEYEKEQAEFNHYRMQMMKGGFGHSHVAEKNYA